MGGGERSRGGEKKEEGGGGVRRRRRKRCRKTKRVEKSIITNQRMIKWSKKEGERRGELDKG